jgi:hypothetical protein
MTRNWWLLPELRRTLFVFSEVLIYLSYAAVVPPRGIAPRSIGYRPIALLLSYGGMLGAEALPRKPRSAIRMAAKAAMKVVARRGNAPRSAGCGPAAFLLSYRANENGTRTR